MSKKSWKDHLLSSGLPLEQSVVQILAKLGVEKPTEYKYQRNNEFGIPTIFSIDVYATQIYDLEPQELWLDIFCECKYRHDAVRWIFTPDEFGRWPRAKFKDAFIILDQLAGNQIFDTDYLDRFSDKYDLCSKGIEILENDANPKSIEQCIQQLRYGLIDKVLDAFIHQVDELLGTPSPIFILLPIIITTAELWRIRPGTTIQNIRDSSELHEVGDRCNVLTVLEKPDNLSIQYTYGKLNEGLTNDQKTKIDRRLKELKLPGYLNFLSSFSSRYPSMFFVFNYKHFATGMKNLLSFFNNQDLIKER